LTLVSLLIVILQPNGVFDNSFLKKEADSSCLLKDHLMRMNVYERPLLENDFRYLKKYISG